MQVTHMAQLVLRERVASRLLMGLSQNYRSPVEALLEFIDNAADDRISGQSVSAEILISASSIEVRNSGGRGMGKEELENFLNWGASQKQQRIGRYGQGGKAACMYLGTELRLTCARIGEPYIYELRDPRWGERDAEDDFRTYPINRVSRDGDQEGFTIIEVRRLRKHRRMDPERLRAALGDVYRLPLYRGWLHIELNGTAVRPLEIPAEVRDEFNLYINGPGRVSGWVGVAPVRYTAVSGVRVCLLGRKVKEGERFGCPGPATKAALARIVGEVDVERLEPNVNKTDFNRASLSWTRLERLMRDRLEPLVQELSQAPEEQEISDDERERCRKVGEEFAEFLRSLREARELVGEIASLGTDAGQKPPEPHASPENRQDPHARRGSNEPATPPPPGAIGKRRRTKSAIQPELTSTLPVNVRSRLEERAGAKVLLVNTEFPAYKLRKSDPLYLAETLCMEYAKPVEGESLDHVAYIAEFDRLLAEFCRFQASRKKMEPRGSRKRERAA